jgi:hypothetical protein
MCKSEACLYVIQGEMREGQQKIRGVRVVSQVLYHSFDGHARTFHDRLTRHDLGV